MNQLRSSRIRSSHNVLGMLSPGLKVFCLFVVLDGILADTAKAQEQVSPSVSVLIEKIRRGSNSTTVRIDAIRAVDVESLSGQARYFIKPLTDVFRDIGDEPRVREEALTTLTSLNVQAEVLPVLIDVFIRNDETTDMRKIAILGIFDMVDEGTKANPALKPRLIQALRKTFGSSDLGEEIPATAVDVLAKMMPEGKEALPDLIDLLHRKYKGNQIHTNAVEALYNLDKDSHPISREVINALTDVFRNFQDIALRQKAADRLGWIGEASKGVNGTSSQELKQAAATLLDVVKNKNDKEAVRASAAIAIGKIKLRPDDAVSILIERLTDKSEVKKVRENSAIALGEMGIEAKRALESLVGTLNDSTEQLPTTMTDAIARTIAKIATSLQEDKDRDSIPMLKGALGAIERLGPDSASGPEAREVKLAIEALDAMVPSLWHTLVEWLLDHKLVLAGTGYIILALAVSLAMLGLHPLSLLRINDWLRPFTDFRIPLFSGFSVSARYFVAFGFFHYHPRVLDAWVGRYIDSAREIFEQMQKDKDRGIYVELKTAIYSGGNRENAILKPQMLRTYFVDGYAVLLIRGEGGCGKTSLACQIARWGMSKDKATRLCEGYYMMPVVIASDLDKGEDRKVLVEKISGQVKRLIKEKEPPSEDLISNLLKHRRILVIVDGLSELSEATRNMIQPGKPDFPINTLLVTSRNKEELDGVPNRVTMNPLRLKSDQLLDFVTSYLRQYHDLRGKQVSDEELNEYGQRVSLTAGGGDMTVLLAKRYAELMVSREARADDNDTDAKVPDNIPDLMLFYLDELNKGITEGALANRTVHRIAKIVAWECLRQTYRPSPAEREEVLDALRDQGEDEKALDYLEKRLRLLSTIEPEEYKIRFTLQPLAEYLAGLYLVDQYRAKGHTEEEKTTKEQSWREFIERISDRADDQKAIRTFLLAVRDCCLIKGAEAGVPDFVATELAMRVGREPQTQAIRSDAQFTG